jgi:hypothetical protein
MRIAIHGLGAILVLATLEIGVCLLASVIYDAVTTPAKETAATVGVPLDINMINRRGPIELDSPMPYARSSQLLAHSDSAGQTLLR